MITLEQLDFDGIRKSLTEPHDYLESVNRTKLFYRYWLPEKETPSKIILCLHGLGGHGADYKILGEPLMKSGVATYALDQRGHGLSEGERGDVESFSLFIEDLDKMVDLLRYKHGSIPIFILGESMGGIICINYAADNSKKIAGLILAAPGIKQRFSLQLKDIPFILFCVPYGLIFQRARIINLAANWDRANRVSENIQMMANDPLLIRGLCFHFVLGIIKYNRRILKECCNMIGLPTLILQGTEDQILSPDGAQEFYDKLKTLDKEIKFLDGASHGLFADPCTAEVVKTITKWIEKH